MTVAIRQLSVPRHQRFVTQGQTVTLFATFEQTAGYNVSVLLDLAELPRLSVFKPDDTVYINSVSMIHHSVGLYYFSIPTATLPLGPHKVTVAGLWGGDEALLHKIVAFNVVRLISAGDIILLSVGAFAIKDQDGSIWYWWFGGDNTLNSTPAPPVINGKQTQIFPMEPIPYWLQMQNAGNLTKYVWPQLSGDALVTDSPPAIGTGYVGSPSLIAVSNDQVRVGVAFDDTVVPIVE